MSEEEIVVAVKMAEGIKDLDEIEKQVVLAYLAGMRDHKALTETAEKAG